MGFVAEVLVSARLQTSLNILIAVARIQNELTAGISSYNGHCIREEGELSRCELWSAANSWELVVVAPPAANAEQELGYDCK